MFFRRQQFLQGLQSRKTTSRVLFAIAAGKTDAADDFIVDDDGKAADENRELAVKAPLNPERFVAWKRRPVRRSVAARRRRLRQMRPARAGPRQKPKHRLEKRDLARPIPCDAPVTSAVFSLRSLMVIPP